VSEAAGLVISTKQVDAPVFTLPADEIIRLLKTESEVNCKTTSIIIESDIYIFVPTAFFKPEEASYFLTFEHKLAKNERIAYNTIPAWNTVNVFNLPLNLLQALTSLFPGVSIEHHMSRFLTEKIRFWQESSVNVWARPKAADLIVVKDGKLQLLNSFPYQTPEDFTYHTLNVMEQLSIDTENTSIYLYNTEKTPEFEKLLSNYSTVFSA
jgi:hypothetical protein